MMNILDSFELVTWRERCIYREEETKLAKGGKEREKMKMRVKNNNLGFGNLGTEVLKKPEKEVRE